MQGMDLWATSTVAKIRLGSTVLDRYMSLLFYALLFAMLASIANGCDTPPTITHGNAIRVPSSKNENYEVREHYFYVCDENYKISSRYNRIICIGNNWEVVSKNGQQNPNVEFPKCVIDYYGNMTDYDYYDDGFPNSNTKPYKKRKSWSAGESIIAIVIIVALLGVCSAIRYIRYNRLKARQQAMVLSGATITTTVSHPPPGTYPTQPGMYPPPGSYPAQPGMYAPPGSYPPQGSYPPPGTNYPYPPPDGQGGGMYPPESYPLNQVPPATHTEVVYKPTTTPAAV